MILLIGLQNGLNMNTGYDYKKCMGLKVKPRQGDGLLFYSVFPNGTIDQVIVIFCCIVWLYHSTNLIISFRCEASWFLST